MFLRLEGGVAAASAAQKPKGCYWGGFCMINKLLSHVQQGKPL